MCDKIPIPSVKTIVKIGNFTMNVYAYRSLTEAECRLAVSMYKRKKHIKKLPATGSVDFITTIGSNPEDDI